MSAPSTAHRKILPAVVAAVAIVASWFVQGRLNVQRETLGLTRTTIISNAPPVLAFTTVALGGFRGLIANALWIRTSDLQDDGKYFEAVQLADWITKLQPHFSAVWVYQAWNMAYNISVKFPDLDERWHWVQHGFELLRDEGLKYNPNQALMYRELAWIFHHKMGAFLDDAHWIYKTEWAELMEVAIPGGRPDYDALLAGKTEAAKAQADNLRSRYKLDPVMMKRVDDTYGPLDWRLPETHAIYWAMQGIEHSPAQDKIPLRREIFQPMLASFMHGRIITNSLVNRLDLAPNLDMIANASKAYEDAVAAEPDMADHLSTAHRNFLREAIYFLYANNREREARKWYEYIRKRFGFGPATGVPENATLEDYVLSEVGSIANETSRERVTAILRGMILRSYVAFGQGEEDAGISYDRLATRLWENYKKRTDFPGSNLRVQLADMKDIKKRILLDLLAPSAGVNPDFQKALRTRLNLPADFGAKTNAPAGAEGTNAPAASNPPPAAPAN